MKMADCVEVFVPVRVRVCPCVRAGERRTVSEWNREWRARLMNVVRQASCQEHQWGHKWCSCPLLIETSNLALTLKKGKKTKTPPSHNFEVTCSMLYQLNNKSDPTFFCLLLCMCFLRLRGCNSAPLLLVWNFRRRGNNRSRLVCWDKSVVLPAFTKPIN